LAIDASRRGVSRLEDADASSALLLRASLKASRVSRKDSGIELVKGSVSASPAPALRFSTGAVAREVSSRRGGLFPCLPISVATGFAAGVARKDA
jgi:hypothetical protein